MKFKEFPQKWKISIISMSISAVLLLTVLEPISI